MGSLGRTLELPAVVVVVSKKPNHLIEREREEKIHSTVESLREIMRS